MIRPLLFAALLAGCQDAAPPPPEFDGDRALAYVKTQLDFGPRIPGTEGHVKMAAWLDSLLRARADSVVVQAWDQTTVDGKVLPLRNYDRRLHREATKRRPC